MDKKCFVASILLVKKDRKKKVILTGTIVLAFLLLFGIILVLRRYGEKRDTLQDTVLVEESSDPGEKPLFTSGRMLVKIRNGDRFQYGYIDNTGKMKIEAQYEMANPFNEGIAAVRLDGVWGFIDINGEIVIKPQFDEVQYSAFSDGIAMVKKDGKWGVINTLGEFLIEPSFVQIGSISEGLMAFQNNGKWGFVNLEGEVIAEAQFDEVSYFSEGLAGVRTGQKTGYINTTGELAIPQQFDGYSLYSFHEGIAVAESNGKYGYIDTQGSWVVEPQFGYAYDFCDGMAKVEDVERNFVGAIDDTGKLILDMIYDCESGMYGHAVEGMLEVSLNGKWGFADTSGNIIVKPQYDGAGVFSDGFAPVKKDGKWGVIDKTGNIVIIPQLDSAPYFKNGIAFVKGGLIDTTGKFIYPSGIKLCSGFATDGYAAVYIADIGYTVIDRKGKILFEERYAQIYKHDFIFAE